MSQGINADIVRHNPSARWSDATIFNGLIHFVEVPSVSEASIVAQTNDLLAAADATLLATGSRKDRILMATIYLTSFDNKAEFDRIWEGWLAPETAPARACVRADLARPDMLVEIAFVAAAGASARNPE